MVNSLELYFGGSASSICEEQKVLNYFKQKNVNREERETGTCKLGS